MYLKLFEFFCHQEKIFACFVDFRKTYDSVWHDGLLYKLRQINVGGNFHNLIKGLYHNSTGSIRIENSQTRSFQYARRVRHGYINDLLFSLAIFYLILVLLLPVLLRWPRTIDRGC